MKNVRQSLSVTLALTVAMSALSGCAASSEDLGGDDQSVTGESQSSLFWRHRIRRWRWWDSHRPTKPVPQKKDIVDTAVANGSFTILAKALTDSDLVATLKSKGPFTVFAPTDAAFEALGAETLASLTPEQLKTILTYHVVAGDLTSGDLTSGPVATVSGLTAFVHVEGASVKVNDATVTTADVDASNGVIHVIDKVLLPPNLVEAARLAGTFSTLLGAATTAGLADTLAAPDANLTVFAPTDDAFAEISDTVAGLSTSQLADVLKYHVVAGKVLSTDLTEGSVPTLLSGQSVDVSLDDGVHVNDASVLAKDVVTTNGVIHVIDQVLIPAL